MDAEIIFDRSIKKLGGRYKLETEKRDPTYLLFCRDIGLEIINHMKKSYSLPDIHLDFIDNDKSFNAVAFKREKSYFIGINTETVNRLHIFFKYIMSFPEVLSSIGNSKNEIAPKNIDLNNFNRIIEPKDKFRMDYSEQLLNSALQFLILHELGHIINGHVDLIEEWSGIPFISEMADTAEKSDISKLDFQTLEFDADSFATNIGLQIIFIQYKTKEQLQEHVQPFFKSLEDAIFLWSFSTYAIFRFLDTNKYDFNGLDNYLHPYPGIRQHSVLDNIYSILEDSEYLQEFDLNKSDYNLKHRGFLKGAIELENAIKIIKKGPITWDFLNEIQSYPVSDTYTDEGLTSLYQIQNNWRNIRPQLKPCTGYLPPIVDLGTLANFKRRYKIHNFSKKNKEHSRP